MFKCDYNLNTHLGTINIIEDLFCARKFSNFYLLESSKVPEAEQMSPPIVQFND